MESKLSGECCKKLADEIEAMQEIINRVEADPVAAVRSLGEIRLGLFRMNQILYSSNDLIQTVATEDPLDPNAA